MAKATANIRIAFLSVATHLGGGERSLLDLLIQAKQSAEFELIIVFPDHDGPFLERVRAEKIPYVICQMPQTFLTITRDKPLYSTWAFLRSIPALLRYFFRLRTILKQQKASLIHTNGIKCHIIGAVVARSLNLPLIWHARDIFSGFTKRVLRAVARFTAPWIIFNSRAAQTAFGPYAKGNVIYNGISLPPKRPAENISKHLKKDFYFGMLGVLARWKGQDLFLDLARELQQENCGFVIIGGRIYDTASDIEYEAELHQKAKGLPVVFLGQQDHPFDYLRQMHCLVHCSKKPEPFGRVIVEAQLAEIPVIAAGAGGVLEIINHDHNGLLYRPNQLAELKTQAERVLKNPTLRSNLARAGKETALHRFTIAAHYQEVASLYRQLL